MKPRATPAIKFFPFGVVVAASPSHPSTKPAMKHWLTSIIVTVVLGISMAQAQPIDLMKTTLQPVNVSSSTNEILGRSAVRVTKDPAIKAFDEPTFVKLVGTDFTNGTIEVEVLSRFEQLPFSPPAFSSLV